MQIVENIAAIHETIKKTCAEFDCDAARINLIAVSKKQEESRIEAALAAGQRVFGENRVQEAQERWGARRSG